MDFLKLAESIEELLYRIALWAILLPRTLWFVVSRPARIQGYVTAELAKDADKRFEANMSPVLFWVLAGLVPLMMLLDLLAGLPDSRIAREALWVNFMHAPWTTRLLVVSVASLAGPLGFSVRILRRLAIPIDRNSLRLPFMVQCYCYTPFFIAMLPVVYLMLRYDGFPAGTASTIGVASAGLAAGWLLLVESMVLARQLSIPHGRAALTAVLYLVYVIVLLFILELVVITLFQGLSVWATTP